MANLTENGSGGTADGEIKDAGDKTCQDYEDAVVDDVLGRELDRKMDKVENVILK
jgi:hypothetical protein